MMKWMTEKLLAQHHCTVKAFKITCHKRQCNFVYLDLKTVTIFHNQKPCDQHSTILNFNKQLS